MLNILALVRRKIKLCCRTSEDLFIILQ